MIQMPLIMGTMNTDCLKCDNCHAPCEYYVMHEGLNLCISCIMVRGFTYVCPPRVDKLLKIKVYKNAK